ncbi:MAG: hypothetical protein U5K79_03275 [Cyclobacteriaceae bacterium]|nr:hypothetical protein [Cyclobacteriaceae bacterium]
MAANQFVVYLTDYTIIFGLIVLGLALFVGIASRGSRLLEQQVYWPCSTFPIHLWQRARSAMA